MCCLIDFMIILPSPPLAHKPRVKVHLAAAAFADQPRFPVADRVRRVAHPQHLERTVEPRMDAGRISDEHRPARVLAVPIDDWLPVGDGEAIAFGIWGAHARIVATAPARRPSSENRQHYWMAQGPISRSACSSSSM